MPPARPTRARPLEEPTTEIVDEAERAVRQAGQLRVAKLTAARLTLAAREVLASRLVARGLVRRGTWIGAPLEDRVVALVAGGARVPCKDVRKRVGGPPAAELGRVLGDLVRTGAIRLVVRGTSEVLVGCGEQILELDPLARLARLAAELQACVRKMGAKGPARSILREDVERFASELRELASAQGAPAATPKSVWARVSTAMRRLEDPTLRLVSIPDLVRALEAELPAAQVHAALRAGARDGLVQLRPDSSPDLLSEADRSLCLPGPGGAVLSYANLLAGTEAG